MKVYQAINKVQDALSKIGIAKDSKNQVQNFNFRGIDAVYNAMSPLLAQHGLCILPRMISRICEERVNAKGTALFYVTVEAEFDLVSAEDGSKHTIKTFGEAMDSGDKATNKAMSAAYKYACFQAFAIPTEGDNDADAHTHEIKSKKPVEVKPVEVNDAKPVKVSESVIVDNITAINEAENIDELKKIYTVAFNAVQPDGEAMARITAAKDKRKIELQTGLPAVGGVSGKPISAA
jgi:hypothetical protein